MKILPITTNQSDGYVSFAARRPNIKLQESIYPILHKYYGLERPDVIEVAACLTKTGRDFDKVGLRLESTPKRGCWKLDYDDKDGMFSRIPFSYSPARTSIIVRRNPIRELIRLFKPKPSISFEANFDYQGKNGTSVIVDDRKNKLAIFDVLSELYDRSIKS